MSENSFSSNTECPICLDSLCILKNILNNEEIFCCKENFHPNFYIC